MTDLDALLRSSDVVAVLVSITPESRGCWRTRARADEAFGVPRDTSRGEAVDEGALYRSLKEKRIAGAALDSFTSSLFR